VASSSAKRYVPNFTSCLCTATPKKMKKKGKQSNLKRNEMRKKHLEESKNNPKQGPWLAFLNEL